MPRLVLSPVCERCYCRVGGWEYLTPTTVRDRDRWVAGPLVCRDRDACTARLEQSGYVRYRGEPA